MSDGLYALAGVIAVAAAAYYAYRKGWLSRLVPSGGTSSSSSSPPSSQYYLPSPPPIPPPSSSFSSGYVTVPLFGTQRILSGVPAGSTVQAIPGTRYEAVFGPPQAQYGNIPQIEGVIITS